MAVKFLFNPFTANFDYVEQTSSDGGGEPGPTPGVNSLTVTAPLTKSGLNTDPILGMDLRSLSELP